MEQRYQAVLAVIRDGVPIVEVARRFDVSRQTPQPVLGPKLLADVAVRTGMSPVRSKSVVFRLVELHGLFDSEARKPRNGKFRGWERGAEMQFLTVNWEVFTRYYGHKVREILFN